MIEISIMTHDFLLRKIYDNIYIWLNIYDSHNAPLETEIGVRVAILCQVTKIGVRVAILCQETQIGVMVAILHQETQIGVRVVILCQET